MIVNIFLHLSIFIIQHTFFILQCIQFSINDSNSLLSQ